ncbi:MAG: lytic transglycosylase domain-containing protein [Candidatus Sericytochromatia bacterium]|nr:lytic transglycosylase domain-containing protein [Candidatus Sericytochromatia bacterium]
MVAVLPSGSLRAFIRLTNRGLPAEMMDRIAVALVRECDRNDLDPRVVAALIAHESSFNPRAVSSSGALGLGQLMPGTARWLGVQDSFDPDQNIAGICRYLRTLNERGAKDPDWIIILASYRLGQGTVKRALETTRAIPAVGRDYARDILGRASRITSLT